MACKQDMLNMTISGDMICNAVKSCTMSKRFTQAIVKASILNILYQRMVVNEGDLKTRKIEDTPHVAFRRKNAKDPLLREYVMWMKGVADAIDKNYLKEVFLFMKNPGNEEIIETYRFSLKYNMDENKENRRTSSQLKRATLELFQVINALGESQKLSENTEVQLELTYVDTTPLIYEPPGFDASIGKYCLQAPDCGIPLGALTTGYHKIACYGGGELFKERVCTPPIITEVVTVHEAEKGKNHYEETTLENVTLNVEEDENTTMKVSNAKAAARVLNMSNITVSDQCDKNFSVLSEKSVEMTEEQYTCICQLTIPLDADIIECMDCKKPYHAPCHGFLCKEDACRADFTCIDCSDKDSVMHGISIPERPLFCRLRLILYFLDKRGQLPIDVLKLLSEHHRNTIIQKLENFNVIGKKSSKINQVSLRKVLEKFFELEDSQMF